MNAPDSVENLPAWVRWLAQDADGTWWGYEIEPLQFHRGWYENELGRRICVCRDAPDAHWSESLRKLR